MTKYTYPEAKKLIQSICKAAGEGEYDTREKFLSMLDDNRAIATQGYNAFGKIFYWNYGSTALYGYKEYDVVNKDLVDLILPQELRQYAREMISVAQKTGKFPDPSSCDLIARNGEYVTVYSGHLVFQWEEGSQPEFYCIDVAIDPVSA